MIVDSDDLRVDVLVQGYPGRSGFHGPLAWSTVALVRIPGHIVLMDSGGLGMRQLVRTRLADLGLTPEDVTDVLLSHSHYDHAVNWVMFDRARIVISAAEMTWALTRPTSDDLVPHLYVEELSKSSRLYLATDGEEVLPGVTAYVTFGHTPGHLTYAVTSPSQDVIFTGDAAKNRAELTSRNASLSYEQELSAAGMAKIWDWWQRRPGTILIAGHDMPMAQEEGVCRYIDKRRAEIHAWFGDELSDISTFDLGAR